MCTEENGLVGESTGFVLAHVFFFFHFLSPRPVLGVRDGGGISRCALSRPFLHLR